MSPMRAIVVGAGIGGLTTALSLHRRGVGVVVYEQADAVRELGVGINILSPAVAELAQLSLLEALDAVAVRTGTLVMTNRFGQPIISDPRGLDAGLPFPQFSIHRGRLQGVLAETLQTRAGPGVIQVDHQFERFEQDDRGVRAVFVDRTGARRTAISGDVLVGADGIRSAVRSQLLPDEGEPRWNGLTLWRGAADWPAFADGRTMILAGGYASKVVVYPIGPGRTAGTRLTNWGLVAPGAPPGTPPPRPVTHRDVWSQPARREQVAPHLARLHSDLVDLTGLVAATDPIYEYPMCDRDPIERWSHGRVTLLGDAAHPMYPMGSNGATQAIIDAACLGAHVAEGTAVESLRAYERDRLEATNRIVMMNREGGSERVMDVVEEAAPGGFAHIDDVIDPAELRRTLAEYAAAGSPARSGAAARRTG
jgi:2-polyprenyl-6-methoxyphenol hydroxylase-like FAD-dependent oxidoreductase